MGRTNNITTNQDYYHHQHHRHHHHHHHHRLRCWGQLESSTTLAASNAARAGQALMAEPLPSMLGARYCVWRISIGEEEEEYDGDDDDGDDDHDVDWLITIPLFRKYAPRCTGCGKMIVPVEGKGEAERVVVLDRNYHLECHRCEVSKFIIVVVVRAIIASKMTFYDVVVTSIHCDWPIGLWKTPELKVWRRGMLPIGRFHSLWEVQCP